MANEAGKAQADNLGAPSGEPRVVVLRGDVERPPSRTSLLEQGASEGDSPVCDGSFGRTPPCRALDESRWLGLQREAGGKLHPRLNTIGRPIANK